MACLLMKGLNVFLKLCEILLMDLGGASSQNSEGQPGAFQM